MERLRLPAQLSSLEIFREFVERTATAIGVGPEQLLKIELVLEELLVNHVRYAYASASGESEVLCTRRAPATFVLEVRDDGPAFDPLQRPPPDLTLPAAERPVGGLGIHLVRTLTDAVSYRREDGRNIVTACFHIAYDGEP